jgi:hypothetical protein
MREGAPPGGAPYTFQSSKISDITPYITEFDKGGLDERQLERHAARQGRGIF